MPKRLKISSVLAFPLAVLLPVAKVYAAAIIPPGGGGSCSLSLPGGYSVTGPASCKFADFGAVISAFLPPILGIAGFVTVIIIVISGIQFVTSGGNPEAAAAARVRLTFAIIGFVIIVLACAILQILNRLFLGTTIA